MTPLERHLGRVAGLGCALCWRLGLGSTPPQLHHPRVTLGGAQRASDWLVIPLCPEHHQGSTGLHGLGPRAFERRYAVDELGLLADTIERLANAA